MKRADIAITTIIAAVIALVVLVVVILIFTGKMQIINLSISNCQEKGGTCIQASDPDAAVSVCSDGFIKMHTNCEKEHKGYCCIKLKWKLGVSR